MACSITLFDYLGGTPDPSGTWTLTGVDNGGGTTMDVAVDGGSVSTIAIGNAVGSTDIVTIEVSDTVAGDYEFTYTVAGGGSCAASTTVTVTVVDGAISGVTKTVNKCSDDDTVYNLWDFIIGGDGEGNPVDAGYPIAVTAGGTWSGTGTAQDGYEANTAAATDDTIQVFDGVSTQLIPAGTYTFVYTNDAAPTAPTGCTNCDSTATLTLVVYETPEPGTAGTVTLCNNPA